MNSNGTSAYIEVESPDGKEVFHIRFSDHEQPGKGSFYTDKYGNSGRRKADLSIVLHDDAFNLKEAWKFLQENRGDRTDRADVTDRQVDKKRLSNYYHSGI